MPIPKVLLWVLLTVFVLPLGFSVSAQELTGNALLVKAIQYHDPNKNWSSFKGALTITMATPNSSDRSTKIQIDFPAQFFSSTVQKDGNTIISTLDKEDCTQMLNGSAEIPKAARDSLRISCDRAKMTQDYYTYLYGLPMKLKDAGTNIYETVQKKAFKGKEYLVLKVDYKEAVGKDTWYFYFDPKTYALEVYQFYHDESKNDGEYILLTETMEVNDIKMPKIRAWYYNKDNAYLGTDTLSEAEGLE